MLKNYIKTAIRNLYRNKTYSFINIFGLALGLATGFIMLLFVNNEYNMNLYHKNADRIYELMARIKFGQEDAVWEQVQAPVANVARGSITDVEKITRFKLNGDKQVIQYNNRNFVEDKYGYAENEFFDVFDFPVVSGDPTAPFAKGLSAVITESTAKKYFGNEDPIGKTIVFRDTTCFVSAVLKDPPPNSSMQFDILFSLDVRRAKFRGNGNWKTIDQDWGNYDYNTFFLLRKNGSLKKVTSGLTAALKKTVPESGLDQYLIRPLKDVYLYKPDGTKGRMIMVEIFFIVSIFILLIAAINYINLVSAKATQRMKEIGVRKIVGANRPQLVRQFFSETGVLLLLAGIVAFFLVKLFVPLYQQISGDTLYASATNWQMWKVIFLIVTAIWLITGSYPAFMLSSFKTIPSLKNEGTLSKIGLLRKSLVVLQFVISITLLLGTVFVHKQMNYVQTRNLNMATSNVLELPVWRLKDEQGFQNALANLPGLTGMTSASSLLFEGTNSTTDLEWSGQPKGASLQISQFDVDKNFFRFFKVPIKEGRDFQNTSEGANDYILNETAVRKMGLKNPVGQSIKFHDQRGIVIGIVKDFHFESLHTELAPAIMRYDPSSAVALYVHVQPDRLQTFINHAQNLWKQFDNKMPLEYKFLDDQVALQYDKENRAKKLFDAFTFITLFISCLGLFGLATHSAERRVKEIGIRKVLGASIINITSLLSKEFFVLLLIAICISVPLVYLGMSKLLQYFAYRITLQWWVFALTSFVVISAAMLTVGFQTIKAARLNPVKNLRNE